ncbi:uncharacterized protein LOC141619937 [Silene latifolia]|uniref:uncharacterized protein LOC141619937 n=1 Tax=Silene latifolia TaxID=37657 RepID=UPI003D775315
MFYNSSFAFTSLGVKKDHEFAHRNRGIYTFRVQGQVYHFINDILPTEERPWYIQLYFYDTNHEMMHRLQISPDFRKRVIDILMKIMDSNPYAKFFRSLRTLEVSEATRIFIRADPMHDQRTQSAPTTSHIATIWVEDDTTPQPLRHDILVYACSGQPHRILHYYSCYDPLQYPLLFPFGETGWYRAIYRRGYRRHHRRDCPTFPINEVLVQSVDSIMETEDQGQFSFRNALLQQFIVDMYIKIETTRLDFIKCNQKTIRAELYQGIIDSYNADETNVSNIGHYYILPAGFIGCDRDLRCRYLNSMGLVQRNGKPDIFLTITCNPIGLKLNENYFRLKKLKIGHI